MNLNSNKIHAELDRIGMTQARLAELCKMTKQGLSFALRQKTCSWRTLEKIAKVFQLNPKELLR